MPELPEVESFKQYLEGTSLNQKISSFSCRDERLLKMSLSSFREHLIGEEFTKCTRIGKYLFVHTSGKKVLVIHFGMTGRLTYYKDEEDRPKFAHIVFDFENGFHLGFENKRKFGWIDLADSQQSYKEDKGLSDDARDLKVDNFLDSMKNRKTAIKAVLLDQSVAAGIGNWMADEILYQAKIHPASTVDKLDEDHLRSVFDAMKHVIEVSIEKEAVHRNFPEDFFIHNRHAKGKCFHTGVAVEKDKVGGRTTFFSPKWQKIID